MTGPETRTRRRRRRSPFRRAWRSLALDRHPLRAVVLLIAAVVAAGALVVGLGNLAGGNGEPVPSTALSSPAASASGGPGPSATGGPGPLETATADASLPAIPTAGPSASASVVPGGVVARRIRIDRLGISLRIVEGDGIDAPMNKAAHYPGTGWPRGGTNIYIYAHAQKGMFLALWDAKVGDEVLLDLADGTTARYLVTQVKPRVPWNALQYTEPTPTERLTLQTSTSYTPTAPRFIVIAEPAP